MNEDVRALFRQRAGFDPIEIFGARKDEASRRAFLDFRAELAGKMQEEWIGELEAVRRQKPDLDLVLTHVDDRFDPGMRDAIGADAARVLPLLDTHSFTFLIEDPATVWNLGAQRYAAIAERYRGLTTHSDRLAIDLNIVDRYQNVYPTKQQTGTELFELVHQAAANFQRVALYFENSLLPPDLGLLASARGRGDANRKNRVKDRGGIASRGRIALEGTGVGGWAAVAGGGRRNGLAAGGGPRGGGRQERGGDPVGAAERRFAVGAGGKRHEPGILLSIRGAGDRGVRPYAASRGGRRYRTVRPGRRSNHDSAAQGATRRDNQERVS